MVTPVPGTANTSVPPKINGQLVATGHVNGLPMSSCGSSKTVWAIKGVVPKAASKATPITSRRGFIKLFIFPVSPKFSHNYPQSRAEHWVKGAARTQDIPQMSDGTSAHLRPFGSH